MDYNGMSKGKRWVIVTLYAIAMAWVESAVVYYLRTLCHRIEPYQPEPLPLVAGLGRIELIREAATLAMLFAVGMLAGKNWRSRWGYAAVAFGVWDIFYYVFLRAMCPWPKSLSDWDILFLLPLPWWGPVIAPVLIALLMIVWGTLASQWEHRYDHPLRCEWREWLLNLSGIILALYVFMEDALRIADQGETAWRNMLPRQFNWPLFVIALALMTVPVAQYARRLRRQKTQPVNSTFNA